MYFKYNFSYLLFFHRLLQERVKRHQPFQPLGVCQLDLNLRSSCTSWTNLPTVKEELMEGIENLTLYFLFLFSLILLGCNTLLVVSIWSIFEFNFKSSFLRNAGRSGGGGSSKKLRGLIQGLRRADMFQRFLANSNRRSFEGKYFAFIATKTRRSKWPSWQRLVLPAPGGYATSGQRSLLSRVARTDAFCQRF